MAGKYDVKFDPQYAADPLSLIIKKIRNNTDILEFGPANGRLTEYLQKEKSCNVDIVEYDSKTGNEAKQFARHSCIGEKEGDIELDYWADSFQGFKYDYILFADVLEHLRNPAKALKRCKEFLKPDGQIIMSIPNVANNAIVLDLMDGKFRYMDTGLLDRTHIFFFTKETILSMLKENGYNIYSFERIVRSPEDSEFNNSYNMYPSLVSSILKYRDEGETYQYVVSCGLKEDINVLVNSNSGYEKYIFDNILMDNKDFPINIYPAVYFDASFEDVKYIEDLTLTNDGDVLFKVVLEPFRDNYVRFFSGEAVVVEIESVTLEKNGVENRVKIDTLKGNYSYKNSKQLFFYNQNPYILFDDIDAKTILSIKYKMRKIENGIIFDELIKLNNIIEDYKFGLNSYEQKLAIKENEKQEIWNSFVNSKSWKLTEPLRKGVYLGRKIKQLNTFNIARRVYLALPVGSKAKENLKNLFYDKLGFLVKDQFRYQIWSAQNKQKNINNDRILSKNEFTHTLDIQPGKIGIHIHLYYLDLLDEFCQYLSNMPYNYDVLISIIESNADKQAMIKDVISHLPNVNQCIVRVLPNRGRDVAPFFIGFGDLLGNYDFIAHFHTKKSLYTGNEQKAWRNYLLDQLIGSSLNIKKLFWEFKNNPDLGLLYPRPASNIPYVAFTWLSNANLGISLLNKLGIQSPKSTYFDYSAGTMFWARSKALAKLYSGNLTLEDFPVEQGQTDGTIAHAIERIICMVTNDAGMDYYEFDFQSNDFTINYGEKNLWQYFSKSDYDKNVFKTFEIVSFDIFDTLVMRKIAKPEFVNDIIAMSIKKKLGLDLDFKKYRLKAEQILRSELDDNQDVNINQIYEKFAEITGLSAGVCNEIKGLEIQEELNLCTPRKELVEWFNFAKDLPKKIILVSDMYLQSDVVSKILAKCGIKDYNKLYISSETNLRKDNKTIWEYLKVLNVNASLIHIGDNERSDWQYPTDEKFNAYHVMSSFNLFENTAFGSYFLHNYQLNTFSAVLLGPIFAYKFNSPFEFNKNKYFVKNFYELGYIIYGPILTYYMLWLIKETTTNKHEGIWFLARDGYFLKPLYEKICKWLNIKALPSEYLLASRRAASVASFKNVNELYDLLDIPYKGTIKDFVFVRYGLVLDNSKYNQKIELPNDREILKKIIEEVADQILENAQSEKLAYLAYMENLSVKNSENLAIVDMGYAGTIQHYLTNLTKTDYNGYYFATNVKNWFTDNKIHGCFAENEDYGTTKSSLFKYQLILESILTSPDGQLLYFDENINPVYGKPGIGQANINSLIEVHKGIEDYCKSLVETYGDKLFDLNVDLQFFDSWIKTFIKMPKECASEIKEIFISDDDYCNGVENNILDFYKDL